MQLAHGAGLELHQGRRNRLRGREVGRIDDSHLAARDLNGLLGLQAVAVGHRYRTRRGLDRVSRQRAGHVPWEDPPRLLKVPRQTAKGGLGQAEVLGQYLARRMSEPVANQESFVLREVAVVEHQQEFTALLEALN